LWSACGEYCMGSLCAEPLAKHFALIFSTTHSGQLVSVVE
jgi:hypothetical protein